MSITLLEAFSHPRWSERFNNKLAWTLVLGLVFIVCFLSFNRLFDHDEFEAVKSAWKIYTGNRIYVDFFQHHAPFLYYLLTPLFPVFGETETTILAARMLMLGFALGILYLCYAIARILFDRHVAVVSVLFLVATPMFAHKVIEIRPDVPQVFFGLLSVLLLLEYLRSERVRMLVLSAFSLGIAFLFLQKIFLLAVALHGLLLWRVLKGQISYPALLVFSGVFLGTWAIYCLYMLATDQFSQYFFLNFEFNVAKLEQHYHQTRLLLGHISKFNAIILACVLLAVITKKSQLQWEITWIALGILTITMLHRTQHVQYYLLVLPLLAIIAARGWQFISELHSPLASLLILVVFISASASYSQAILYQTNRWQLQKIAYVNDMTTSSDYVYDGNIQFNLFRKDLDYFWFGVGEGRSLDKYRMLTGYEYDIYHLIETLQPTVISDYSIDDMSHPVIRGRYKKTGQYGHLYVRIESPDDE